MLGFGFAPSAQARSYKVLYAFWGSNQGHGGDGEAPRARLVRDAAGNLYGTTLRGGSCGGGGTCGTVFKVDKSGKETVLHMFMRHGDGTYPDAGLLLDATGNLYGTTPTGGSATTCGNSGCGTVFKVDTSGTESVLYNFVGPPDGADPEAGLIRDAMGNLYGTTAGGGAAGYGTVFKIDASGTETVLYSFTGPPDGAYPYAGLAMDASGNLYGTTREGGTGQCTQPGNGVGCGTIFKLDTTGTESVLYSFAGPPDGGNPYAGLIMDAKGNLYGATSEGGSGQCKQSGNVVGCGTIFKLDTTGTESVLYSFSGAPDGAYPYAGLVMDAKGNLYGTTEGGGSSGGGYGTAFKVNKVGEETVLHTFTGRSDGASPFGGLIRDAKGNLYGTAAYQGAHGRGVVFKITP